jgi:hypothetical protein
LYKVLSDPDVEIIFLQDRLAKMMGSSYHPYSDTRFTINQKGADDIEEKGTSKEESCG